MNKPLGRDVLRPANKPVACPICGEEVYQNVILSMWQQPVYEAKLREHNQYLVIQEVHRGKLAEKARLAEDD